MAISKFISLKGDLPPLMAAPMLEALSMMSSMGLDIMDKTVATLQELTPYSSGFLRSQARGWGFRVYGRGGFCFEFGWRRQDFVGRAFYPPFVNYGTGIYGRNRTPIVPRSAPRLVWQDDAGVWHAAASVAGQPGVHMLETTAQYAKEAVSALWAGSTFETLRRYFRSAY